MFRLPLPRRLRDIPPEEPMIRPRQPSPVQFAPQVDFLFSLGSGKGR